jgi:CDP-diacylglycerol--glycerol-3-phosphate 3-phosphatidyltransferase
VLQVALVLSLVVAGELAGVCSDWLGTGRRCEGPLGKVDRAIVFATLNIWLGS